MRAKPSEAFPPAAVDWPAVLRRTGRNDRELVECLAADGLKVGRSTLTELRLGFGLEPRYSVGAALLRLAYGPRGPHAGG